jgi:hypothetical protein
MKDEAFDNEFYVSVVPIEKRLPLSSPWKQKSILVALSFDFDLW